jgi:hypothetical protein
MALIQVFARLNSVQLRRAQKALGAKTASETLQRAWIWLRKRPRTLA